MINTHIGIWTGSSIHPTSAAVRDVSAAALDSMLDAHKSKISAQAQKPPTQQERNEERMIVEIVDEPTDELQMHLQTF